MLPSTQNDCAPSKVCTRKGCKTILPADSLCKSCEKCLNISRLCMQKKRKRDKADEGEQHCLPPIAPTSKGPKDSNSEEDSDTELKHNVSSRITLEWLGEVLPVDHAGKWPCYLSGQKGHLITAKKGLRNIRMDLLLWVLWLTCRPIDVWERSCDHDCAWSMAGHWLSLPVSMNINKLKKERNNIHDQNKRSPTSTDWP